MTTIFFETLVSPAVAQTVASEVGAKTAVLDPLEGRLQDGDYLSGMRANLRTLRLARWAASDPGHRPPTARPVVLLRPGSRRATAVVVLTLPLAMMTRH